MSKPIKSMRRKGLPMARRRKGILATLVRLQRAQKKRSTARKKATAKQKTLNNRYQAQILREYHREQKLAQATQDAWSPVKLTESTPGRNSPGQAKNGAQTGLKPGQCGYPTKDGSPCKNVGKCPYHARKHRSNRGTGS